MSWRPSHVFCTGHPCTTDRTKPQRLEAVELKIGINFLVASLHSLYSLTHCTHVVALRDSTDELTLHLYHWEYADLHILCALIDETSQLGTAWFPTSALRLYVHTQSHHISQKKGNFKGFDSWCFFVLQAQNGFLQSCQCLSEVYFHRCSTSTTANKAVLLWTGRCRWFFF